MNGDVLNNYRRRHALGGTSSGWQNRLVDEEEVGEERTDGNQSICVVDHIGSDRWFLEQKRYHRSRHRNVVEKPVPE